MSFQREMSSGFSSCCRADSDALLWPERTSRTTWALNSGVKDRRRRFGMGGRSWEDSLDYGTGPIPGPHFKQTGPSPVDRSRPGSKHAIATDGRGAPLVIDTIPANTPDANLTVPLIATVPPIAGKPGHPRSRPDRAMGDRGFDDEEQREG
jgi:hypothetical protein